jgi:hypothetical protein
MPLFMQPVLQNCDHEQLIEVPNGVGDQILHVLIVG